MVAMVIQSIFTACTELKNKLKLSLNLGLAEQTKLKVDDHFLDDW